MHIYIQCFVNTQNQDDTLKSAASFLDQSKTGLLSNVYIQVIPPTRILKDITHDSISL